MILFQCSIPGRAYVKKTTQRAVGHGRFKRILYSPNFIAWEEVAFLNIKNNWKKNPITFPVNLKAIFYFQNKMAEPDLSALYEGLQDVLQKCGVVENDRLIHGHDGSRKIFGESPRTEIQLTSIA